KPVLGHGNESLAAAGRIPNPEAYQAYMKGRYHLAQRVPKAALEKAIENFQQAIGIDPSFALAYLGLAETYAVIESNSQATPGTAVSRARVYAEKALELDDRLGAAYAALGCIAALEWKWNESERLFQEALTRDPAYATAWHWHATTL